MGDIRASRHVVGDTQTSRQAVGDTWAGTLVGRQGLGGQAGGQADRGETNRSLKSSLYDYVSLPNTTENGTLLVKEKHWHLIVL